MAGYHKYVFDTEKRLFVGEFEKMYREEDVEGFDSWFEADLRPLRKQISRQILDAYSFSRCLDIGCGKGTFTQLLKKQNNYVMGIDLSETAIQKAKRSYPDVDFRCMTVDRLPDLSEKFDLVVVMGTFAYVAEWPKVVETVAGMTRWFYVAEYIPPNPIGFVKSRRQLIDAMEERFHIRTKVLLDDDQVMLFAEVKET